MITFETRMLDTKGRPTGFDYLRLFLAISVVVLHFFPINLGYTATAEIFAGWRRPLMAFVLPMFFALSGFLISGSLYRSSSLFVFLGLRVIRIVPALAVEVTLSALVLGPIFTSDTVSDYFSSRQFLTYFLNIIGDIHFFLPGVFLENVHPRVVNEQLWTIPWELKCYLAITVIALFRIHKQRYLFAMLVIAANAFLFLHDILSPPENWISVHGTTLLQAFLTGVVLFVFQDKIAFSKILLAASLVLMTAFLATANCEALSVIPAAYATAYLGLTNPRRPKFVFDGDYSYGIYLYSFPIQQAVASFPQTRNWWASLFIVVPATIVVAYISWWKIEKPALAARKKIQVYDGKIQPALLKLSGKIFGNSAIGKSPETRP